MPDPVFLGFSAGLMKKHRLREYYEAVDLAIGGKMRMVLEINKSSDAYWKFQNNRQKLEPKDVNVNIDNSAEALLEAWYAEQRGEVIEFAEDRPQITAQDAEFSEISEEFLVWPENAFDDGDD